LFTPLQLQPRAVFSLLMNGWARWLREHWVAFPRLIRERNLGVVVAGLDLEYLRAFSFFDSDALIARAALTVREDGGLLFFTASFAPSDGSEGVARASAVLRPVMIGEALVLSASPGNLDATTLESFEPNERVAAPPGRRLRGVAEALEAGGAPIGADSHVYTMHRHLCETADQWSAIAMPDLTAEVREKLVSVERAEIPALDDALRWPMRRITWEFHRPVFFLDEFVAECLAYTRDEELIFVHELRAPNEGHLLATSVEWFVESLEQKRRSNDVLVGVGQQGGVR
jgi:acyl-CoA thioesterase FadM